MNPSLILLKSMFGYIKQGSSCSNVMSKNDWGSGSQYADNADEWLEGELGVKEMNFRNRFHIMLKHSLITPGTF